MSEYLTKKLIFLDHTYLGNLVAKIKKFKKNTIVIQ